MLPRIRETLALILLALLPWHALAVTVFTNLVEGPGHAPLPMFALWKEGLLLVILLIAFIEMIYGKHSQLVTRNSQFGRWWEVDMLDVLILFLAILATWHHALSPAPGGLGTFALGFRYDLLALCSFLILRRVQWSERFLQRALTTILISGTLIAAYGLLTLVLPFSFFTALGYSALHSLYVPTASIAAFQMIGETGIARIQSAMSGPNQLGLYLLVPFSIAITQLLQKRSSGFWSLVFGPLGAALITLAAITLTFSRAAWIGTAVIIFTALALMLPRQHLKKIIPSILALLVINLGVLWMIAPGIITRAASSGDHLKKPLEAINIMIDHPFGLGLGTAGPASNRTSETCVMLQLGDDPSWAKDQPNLCVFVGDTKVQPLERDCNCPLLTENWYLQIGVELGWFGMIIFIALTIAILMRLKSAISTSKAASTDSQFAIRNSQFLAFFGLSIAALFLHSWEDTAVAFSVWILVASVLQPRGSQASSSSSERG